MKILILTKYPVRGPSSRYRFFQYLPELNARGHSVTVLPFFTDTYLDVLFHNRRVNPLYFFNRALARLAHCLRGSRHDLAWIEGELVPFLPAWPEKLFHVLLPRKRIYEFDDANWLRYRGKPLLEDKFGSILAGAGGVVVGNPFLQDYVKAFNGNTLVVPTVVDWSKYASVVPIGEGSTIGWIGTRNTCPFLEEVRPALKELSATHQFKLKVVGASVASDGYPVEEVPWSEDSEAEQIATFDIGIMPLTKTPWSEGKCGLKLIQYLAAGVPAVATSVGVNTQYISESRAGYLAEDQETWVFALRKLLDHADLRREMGQNGRDWVRSQMTVQAQASRLVSFLESVVGP